MSKRRNSKKLIIIFAVVMSVFLIAAVAGLAISKSTKVFPNVTLDGIEIGGLSKEEAETCLSRNGYTAKSARTLTINSYSGASVEIDPVKAGSLLDTSHAAQSAVEYGKTGNPFINLGIFVKCLFLKTEFDSSGIPNEEYIKKKASELQSAVDSAFSYDSYDLDEKAKTLSIRKGYGCSVILDQDKLCGEIVNALQSGKQELTYTDLSKPVPGFDFTSLKDRVDCAPAPAYFSADGSHEIVPDRPGYSFDEKELSQKWDTAQPGDEITVPLSCSYSDITAEYLESRMFHDLLGAVTTKYNNSNENRSSNVRLASSKVNGTILYPGEEFSFNKTVGVRTEAAGFLYAPAYAGYDDIQEEIGGGVCQVSTGIYASALYAFLEITAHTCHVYPPNYIQLGCDATVSIPASGKEIDLKFVNSKSYPIKIVSYCEETVDEDTGKPLKTVTVEIWGTLEDNDYMPVEFDNRYDDIYDYHRVIDPPYPDRQGVRLLFTHDETEFEDDTGKGLRTLTYIRVYDMDDNLIDKFLMNRKYSFGYGMDTYYYKQ